VAQLSLVRCRADLAGAQWLYLQPEEFTDVR
jgi:hypothetical protein